MRPQVQLGKMKHNSSVVAPNKTNPLIDLFLISIILSQSIGANGGCGSGCALALASYNVWEGCNLTYISKIFDESIARILRYNPGVRNPDAIGTGTRINVPFTCDCINGDFLGHTFTYFTRPQDTYDSVVSTAFSDLTTESWVRRVNVYDPNNIPDDVPINVTVNCSCGDAAVSPDYGLFLTYPLRTNDSLSLVAKEFGVSALLLESFNPDANFNDGSGLVFVPARADIVDKQR